MNLPPSYRSFLVRLWRDPADGPWRGEVESIQNGELECVESFEALIEILRRAAGLPAAAEALSDVEEISHDDDNYS